MSKPHEVWTPDVIQTLVGLWGTMPASEIGKIIFGEDGKKNAVIGQAHRLGLGEGWKRPLGMSRQARKSTPSYSELVLVINYIHNHAIAARLQDGDDGSLMLEIEELAETALARVCDDGASDTEFTVVEDQP